MQRKTAEDLSRMSISEIKEYKNATYAEAQKKGFISPLYEIAQVLGARVAVTYAKYEWLSPGETIRIFYDQYGGYLTVEHLGKKVCSTHPTAEFFIPGEWTQDLAPFIEQAAALKQQQRAAAEAREKARLIGSLII